MSGGLGRPSSGVGVVAEGLGAVEVLAEGGEERGIGE